MTLMTRVDASSFRVADAEEDEDTAGLLSRRRADARSHASTYTGEDGPPIAVSDPDNRGHIFPFRTRVFASGRTLPCWLGLKAEVSPHTARAFHPFCLFG
jgi:hypothetical protein